MKLTSLLIAITLSILVLFNTLRVSITYAYYKIDPIGFIEKLCENKDKPELQCNGKCHLKKVAEHSPNDSKAPEKVVNFKEILLFISNKEQFSFEMNCTQEKDSFIYKNLYVFYNCFNLDHPPEV